MVDGLLGFVISTFVMHCYQTCAIVKERMSGNNVSKIKRLNITELGKSME